MVVIGLCIIDVTPGEGTVKQVLWVDYARHQTTNQATHHQHISSGDENLINSSPFYPENNTHIWQAQG